MFRSTLAVIGLLGALLFVSKTLSELDESAQKEKSRAIFVASPPSPVSPAAVRPTAVEAVRPAAAATIARMEYPILSLRLNEDGDQIGGPSPVPAPAPVAALPAAPAKINVDPQATVKFITTATTKVVTGLSRVNEAARAAQEARAARQAQEAAEMELAFGSPVATKAPGTVDTNEAKLSPEMIALRDKVRKVLAIYEPRYLNTRDHSAWEVMHSLVAFGVRTNIRRDGPEGDVVNAAGWLTWGGRCQGQSLVVLANDKPYAQQGPGLEGHPGQLLAILAQSRIPADYPIKLSGKSFTIADLIEEEKLECQPNTELTFRLIGLSHYLPSDATWTTREGQQFSIPRLIREEIQQPIHGASCGGSHRLYGIAYSYRTRIRRGEPVDGEYARAQKYTQDYQRFVLGALQNPDGSLSTDWFDRAASSPDLDRRMQTTGHMVEWLAFSLNDNQLPEPKMTQTIDYLSNILLENQQKAWSIGPLGHALHALVVYDERVFQGRTLGGIQPVSAPTKTDAATTAPGLRIARQSPLYPANNVATGANNLNWNQSSAAMTPMTLDWTLQNGWSKTSPLGGLTPRPFAP